MVKRKNLPKGDPKKIGYTRAEDVLSRQSWDGSITIIKLNKDDQFHKIEGLAAEVWNMLGTETNPQIIVKKMEKKHGLPSAQFRKDVTSLIEKLVKCSLLRPVP